MSHRLAAAAVQSDAGESDASAGVTSGIRKSHNPSRAAPTRPVEFAGDSSPHRFRTNLAGAMAKTSAGILMFRRRPGGVEVLLAHPGGPFWARKDYGAWSIPKGIADEGEDLEAAARREFFEETGAAVEGTLIALGAFKQPGGKTVAAFACEDEFNPAGLKSNTFAVTPKHPLLTSERIGLPQSSSFGRFSFVRGSIRLRSEAEPAAPPKSPKNKGVLGSY